MREDHDQIKGIHHSEGYRVDPHSRGGEKAEGVLSHFGGGNQQVADLLRSLGEVLLPGFSLFLPPSPPDQEHQAERLAAVVQSPQPAGHRFGDGKRPRLRLHRPRAGRYGPLSTPS